MSYVRKRWLSSIVGVAVLVSHVAIPFVPGLPALSTSPEQLPQLSGAAAQLWAVEAAILGATLVALFFALGSVQRAEPTKAALDKLLDRIRFKCVLALFTATLAGSGLTVLWLQLPAWRWPYEPPSVGTLPLLDFALFLGNLLALFILTWQAAGYLHPTAVQALTEQQACTFARVVSTHERKQASERCRSMRERFERKERKRRGRRLWPSLRRRRVRPDPPERDELVGLLNEVHERGIKAIEADDLPQLRSVLSVLHGVVRGQFSVGLAAAQAQREHEAPLQDVGSAWDGRHSLCAGRVERNSLDLLALSAGRQGSRCTSELLRFPFSIWGCGLEEDSHGAARFGLELAARCYLQARRATNGALVAEWVRMWREQPYGPEMFLHKASRAIRPTDISPDRVLHYLLAAHEVRENLFLVAALALLHGDAETCGRLLESRSTAANMFWPIRDEHYRFSGAAKQRLAELERASSQGMALLLGMGAVSFYNGAHLNRLLTFMLDVAKQEDLEGMDAAGAMVTANLRGGPRWFVTSVTMTDKAPTYTDGGAWHVLDAEDLQAWAFLLLLPRLLNRPESVRGVDLTRLIAARPELHAVAGRIEKSGREWGSLLPPQFLDEVRRAGAAGRPRRSGLRVPNWLARQVRRVSHQTRETG